MVENRLTLNITVMVVMLERSSQGQLWKVNTSLKLSNGCEDISLEF